MDGRATAAVLVAKGEPLSFSSVGGALSHATALQPGSRVGVDLESRMVTGPDGAALPFAVDPMRRRLLLEGIDEIDYTLTLDDRVRAFEQTRAEHGAAGHEG